MSTLARLRDLGTPRQWVADILAGLLFVAFAIFCFAALGLLFPG